MQVIQSLTRPIRAYTHWLHGQWPAGKPERLPIADADGSTNVPGLFIVGDLTGVPLLKLSMNAGTNVVRQIAGETSFQKREVTEQVLDLAIIGGGTAGFAAAREADRQGLRYCVFEAAEPFFTIVNFPKRKPIYTYPTDLAIAGELQLHEKSKVKEGLLEDLREQTVEQGLHWRQAKVDRVERKGRLLQVVLEGDPPVRAHRAIVAIGRSGNYRRLGVPGEELDKVYNRLHDPADFCGQQVLVIGGGDSALETAIALTVCGADVTLSYRRSTFNRPKPENVEKVSALAQQPDASATVEMPSDPRSAAAVEDYLGAREPRGSLALAMGSTVKAIREDAVDLQCAGGEIRTLRNDTVFAMIGREPPLDFFRRSGVRIAGERTAGWWGSLIGFLLLCTWLFHWKAQAPLLGIEALEIPHWLALEPALLWDALRSLGGAVGRYFSDPATLGGTLAISASARSFYYTLAYSLIVLIFGIQRIQRRRTPYVTWQTVTLTIIQVVPLFLLPELVLPWMGHNGWFDSGLGRTFADTLFPEADYGHGREYWRAYGLILAWPLMVWNWFTHEPLWGWLVLGFLQTFVAIPAMIYFWGKGAYCGWICSCGALAETLGDTHRHKMPHGPGWNRLNMIGQVLLLLALVTLGLYALSWTGVDWAGQATGWLAREAPLISWAWFVDILWAGILGVGLYFWFSGRVWCRFACPLAALMHVYHRFSRFRILAEKHKCISCNVCTSVCHQGIDVMSFANKGQPMADPQCVRCSACVQMCPTGVLSFGQVDPRSGGVVREDPAWLAASPVRSREVPLTVRGQRAQPKKGRRATDEPASLHS